MHNNLLINYGNNGLEKTEDRYVVSQPLYVIKKRKTRLLVQKGLENILLKLEDIVLFYTENKVVYVLDRFAKKYLIDSNLLELEAELDPLIFFRANRQYLVSVNFIKSFKAHEKVKIKIDLSVAELNHSIIVSQETAPCFRKWINEA